MMTCWSLSGSLLKTVCPDFSNQKDLFSVLLTVYNSPQQGMGFLLIAVSFYEVDRILQYR